MGRLDRIKHIYFGANQSFHPASDDETTAWAEMILAFLKEGYWVTLDFDVSLSEQLMEYSIIEYNRFIPMISVKIPYIRQFNQNATVKIDDIGYDKTNAGVWCHALDDLQTMKTFTGWDQYTSDKAIK